MNPSSARAATCGTGTKPARRKRAVASTIPRLSRSSVLMKTSVPAQTNRASRARELVARGDLERGGAQQLADASAAPRGAHGASDQESRLREIT